MSAYIYNDLKLVSNDLSDMQGLTVCALMRNELFMLPSFLDHYRSIGVSRFILLDDQSDDGSREYLENAPDVMVLESSRSFGDRVTVEKGPLAGRTVRFCVVWKTLLMDLYCSGQWSLCVDLDEFIRLPPGWRVQNLIHQLDSSESVAINAVMLDVYPQLAEDLLSQEEFDSSSEWFFDAEQHLYFSADIARFRMSYPGARARLMYQHNLAPLGILDKIKVGLGLRRVPEFNNTSKPVLFNWKRGSCFFTAHSTSIDVHPQVLLPLLHFKFHPKIHKKVEHAVCARQYWNGSMEYKRLNELLYRMTKGGHTFLYKNSKPVRDFNVFLESGNATIPGYQPE